MKKALIIMPTPPFPPLGADEQNRLGIIRLLKELGYGEIVIIAKAREDQMSLAEAGVSLIPYQVKSKKNLSYWIARAMNPFRWDGATDEYYDPRFRGAIDMAIAERKPDLLLVEYNFLWPAALSARRSGIPVIMRSHNFEALHFLSEDGLSLINLFKFLAKLLSEWRSCAVSDVVLAVTVKEAHEYRWLCPAQKIFALHSGALPDLVAKRHIPHDRIPVELLFMGSRYSIPHNLKAARLLIEGVMPAVEVAYPGIFHLSITGGKLPEKLARSLPGNTAYLGYVDDLEAVFEKTDVVIAPRVAGHGMQLKVFEPLCRGIPVVTSALVLGGYPFADGEEVFIADTIEEFVSAIGKLGSFETRRAMGNAAHVGAEALFGKAPTLAIMREALKKAHAL